MTIAHPSELWVTAQSEGLYYRVGLYYCQSAHHSTLGGAPTSRVHGPTSRTAPLPTREVRPHGPRPLVAPCCALLRLVAPYCALLRLLVEDENRRPGPPSGPGRRQRGAIRRNKAQQGATRRNKPPRALGPPSGGLASRARIRDRPRLGRRRPRRLRGLQGLQHPGAKLAQGAKSDESGPPEALKAPGPST